MKTSVMGIALLLMALMGVCAAEDEGLSPAVVAGIVVAAIVVAIAIAVTLIIFLKIFIMRKRGAEDKAAHDNPLFTENEKEMANPAFLG